MSHAAAQPGVPSRPAAISLAGRMRLAARAVLLVTALLGSLPLHFLWRIVAYRSPFPRLFLKMVARIVGARIVVAGTPLKRDVFFLANHVSWIDIPALAGVSGTAFVAKAEVAAAPLIGWLCGLNRTVFVQREARLNVAAQINSVRDALADNAAITIFPEGTTTDGHSLLPFKSSILKALEPPPPGVMVQPVFLDYGETSADIGWVGDEEGLANALKILARAGTFTLCIHFLEPFSPDTFPGRKAIAAEARRRIEDALTRSRGAPPRPFALDVPAVRYVASAAASEAHDRAGAADNGPPA